MRKDDSLGRFVLMTSYFKMSLVNVITYIYARNNGAGIEYIGNELERI